MKDLDLHRNLILKIAIKIFYLFLNKDMKMFKLKWKGCKGHSVLFEDGVYLSLVFQSYFATPPNKTDCLVSLQLPPPIAQKVEFNTGYMKLMIPMTVNRCLHSNYV